MKKIKSKFYKLLALSSCVVIIFLIFSFNVSAVTNCDIEVENTDFDCKLFIQFYESNSDNFFAAEPVDFSFYTESHDRGMIINIGNRFVNTNNSHYYMVLRFIPNGGPASSNTTVTSASLKVGINAEDYDMWESNPYNVSSKPKAATYFTYDGNTSEDPLIGTMTYPNTEYTQYCQVNFKANPDYTYLTNFYLAIPFATYGAQDVLRISLYDYTFKTVSVAQGQTNQIIDNQNKNTQAIIDNQNKFYNENIDFASPGEIDSTTTDDYAKSEEEVLKSTAAGRSESISLFNRFGNLFAPDGHLYRGLLCTSKIFNLFFEIDWVSNIITFGLAVGMFGFVIGTAEIFINSHNSKVRRERSAKAKENQANTYKK